TPAPPPTLTPPGGLPPTQPPQGPTPSAGPTQTAPGDQRSTATASVANGGGGGVVRGGFTAWGAGPGALTLALSARVQPAPSGFAEVTVIYSDELTTPVTWVR